ncbi:MAG: hypothetical protein KAU23_11145 [Anaerolineales bacterium]|nr:hypothetical protein [Anaerolineales bacterium]
MIKNLKVHKALWLLIACLSLVAACIGVFNQDIYSKVVSSDWLPGTIAQDAITIIVGLVLLFLSLKTNESDIRKQIIATSLLVYLFYGYSLYVIEQLYTSLYILYMAIVALSFWSIVYSLVNIKQDVLRHIKASKLVRYLSAGCLIFISLLFYSLWTSQLLTLMRTGDKIEFTYSIYIIDMVFVLPALIMSAILLIKKNALGLIFAPILFIKAFTLLFSVGLGGLFKLLYNQTVASGEIAFYFILSAIFLALAVLNFWKISFQEQNKS